MTKTFQTITNLFKDQQILVVGDVMLDETHWCNVKRISPEAPVPVCEVQSTTLAPGGASNVALNARTLGANAIMIGVVGKDSTGNKFMDTLQKNSLSTVGIVVSDTRPSTLKSRIVAHHQHVARVDREDNNVLNDTDNESLRKRFSDQLPDADLVIISDYRKGTLSDEMVQFIIQETRYAGKHVLVDPKGDDYSRYKGAHILTPNFAEFQAVSKQKLSSEDIIYEEGQHLISSLELESLIVTRSEKGMSIMTSGQAKVDVPTRAKSVYDITGAGDTVIATLGVALASGAKLEDAASLANLAAGVVVGKVGTAAIQLDELLHEIEEL